ncbi:MAG: ABC transporter permease [Planctomycetota bacterium]
MSAAEARISALRGTGAVYRRELAAALEAPASWVVLASFVAALHSLYFFVGFPVGEQQFPGFWEARVAGLQTVFAWLPALLAIVAPALSMGAWAEERRAGTEELLLAWPLPTGATVLGKFLATWTQLALVLAIAILPLALAVSGVGPLDLGVACAGLAGGVLLGGACVAVGQLVSACTRDQLVAFVLGALVLGALWLAGFALRGADPSVATWIAVVSPTAHFLNSAAVGLLDLADVLYFVAVAAAALFATHTAVEARRER